MKIGALRKKITIQTYTEVQDSFGEPVKTWANHAVNRWAEVIPITGREYFLMQQTQVKVDVKFVLRYTMGVLPKMRVVYGGENYDIESVINVDERNRELQLMCKKVV